MIGEDERPPAPPSRNGIHAGIWVVGVCLMAILAVFAIDYFTIGRPVQAALAEDPRNEGFTLSVHRQYRINPGVLVIDLRHVESASPMDLIRGIFMTAETMHESGATFQHVVLARNGAPVFMLSGDDFAQLGSEYGSGQNPLYLTRTLPEKLATPDGQRPYGTWTGGIFGVLGKQMEDVSHAMHRWIAPTNGPTG